MNVQNWQFLIKKYLDNSISKEELDSLLNMIDEQKNYAELKTVLQDFWNKANEKPLAIKTDWNKKIDELFAEAKEQEQIAGVKTAVKTNHWRWLAAASVIFIIVFSKYLFFSGKPTQTATQPITVQVKKDIAAPKVSNAILTLANGKTIVLDSALNGSLATQGNTRVEKLSDGRIVYTGKSTSEIEYNTLTVPKGSKIASITLSDGSKVWLNSASSLTYPVAFIGTEREVTITGEAYFEVARNSDMPFTVKKGETSVTVLGTHFNVNAYEDETSTKITLLEGQVKVDRGNVSKLLKPGQQAQVSSGIKITDDVDIDEVMAWRNGEFQFGEAADITSVMRQIARWYDVDVEYKGDITGHIGGTISRDKNVSQVLQMLQMTGAVKFIIEDKKIVVASNHL